jgi:uncharacterized membrane protein YfcA
LLTLFDLLSYAIGFVLFFVAACTKGILGFGINIVSVPIMSLLVGPKAAVAIVSLPSFLNNIVIIMQRHEFDGLSLFKRIIPLLALGVVGITLGSLLLVLLDTSVISLLLGILTVAFVLTDKIRATWRIPPDRERFYAPLAGLGAGLLGGISGISAPILVTYLYSIKLDKRQFVYTISIIFILFNGAQGLNLWALGVYTPQFALYGLSYIIPITAGTIVGTRIQDKVSQSLFNRLVLMALFFVGLDLIRRGLHLGV